MSAFFRFALLVTAIIAIAANTASAQVVAYSPKLPPKDGKYKSVGDLKYNSNLNIVLKNKLISDFSNVSSTKKENGEKVKFDAKLSAKIIDKNNDDKKKPLALKGKVKMKIPGRDDPKALGDFKLEVKKKDFKGSVDKFGKLYVRENPDLASTGQVSIREINNGQYEFIGSMDVLTEASRDGTAFRPASGPAVFQLVPEPGTTLMFLLGCSGLGAVVYGRQASRR